MRAEHKHWAAQVSALEAEGISVQAYARRERLSAASLYVSAPSPRRRSPGLRFRDNWVEWKLSGPGERIEEIAERFSLR